MQANQVSVVSCEKSRLTFVGLQSARSSGFLGGNDTLTPSSSVKQATHFGSEQLDPALRDASWDDE